MAKKNPKRPAPRTAFKKGQPRPIGSGRQKGTPNKLPRVLRELLQDVLMDAGQGDDPEVRARSYLLDLARGDQDDRKLFVSLLGKTIEKQVVIEHKPLELVVVHNFTGISPAKLKKLGPSILGGARRK